MSESAAKSRVTRSPRNAARAGESVRTGWRGARRELGTGAGLEVRREIVVGEPGDRFEREADAAADRVAQGQSADSAAISPVTPEVLAQTAPEPAEPIKQQPTAGMATDKKPQAVPVQKAKAKPENKLQAAPENLPNFKRVRKAQSVPEQKPETISDPGPNHVPDIHEESTGPKGETSAEKKAVQTDADSGGAAPSAGAVGPAVADKGEMAEAG